MRDDEKTNDQLIQELITLRVNYSKIEKKSKLAEEALRESEERWSSLVNTLPDYVSILDRESRYLFRNQYALGFTEKDVIGCSVYQFLSTTSKEIFEKEISECKKTGRTRKFEHTAMGDNGIMSEYEVYLVPINEKNNATTTMVISRDITERKLSEEAIWERDADLRTAQRLSNIGSWKWKLAENTMQWSEELYRINGHDPKLPVPCFEEMSSFYTPESWKRLNEAIAESLLKGDSFELELDLMQKDGTIKNIYARGEIEYGASGKIIGLHGTTQDITEFKRAAEERKKLEFQLFQAQKIESIGLLAGGVAHDFNNILTVINANAEIPLMFMERTAPYYSAFSEILKAGERAANLTRQLLAFSRKQIIEPRVINLNNTLLEMDKMLRRLIGEHIELVTIIDESLYPVKVDPGQVEQILTNLVVNARDAMPDKGKLTIETRNTILDEKYAKTHPDIIPGKYVTFTVSDTGAGIDKEVISHIFEPFFTTKPKGSGTGLGLSTCFGIVKQNHGEINVYSEPGYGTTFKIHLPIFEGETAALYTSQGQKELPKGTETVLVTEDDISILNIVSDLLSNSGYHVHAASNGHEALAMVRDSYKKFDLLITDVIMPLMGGRELADKLNEIQPNIPVLYMSGYTDNSIVHHGVLEEGVAFIQKPFSTIDFAKKVREILDLRNVL